MVVLSALLLVVLVAIDQITKALVNTYLNIGETGYTFSIGNFDAFSITHGRNSGAAWSILEGKTYFLIAVALAAIIIAFYFIIRGKIKSSVGIISLIMIISGGIGNLIDRIRLGEVIDFIKTEFISFPVFNFADICVVVGAIIFCLWVIISDIKERRKKESASND
ncbi:MAG: signal peptidase II [Ruminococcus sp.]|nr:signal peptidase II [Ruminococcus sp.]